MRVICIDTKPKEETLDMAALKKLVEGAQYTAHKSPHPDGYFLEECSTTNPSGFDKRRFIPLSTIDETELLKQRQTELV